MSAKEVVVDGRWIIVDPAPRLDGAQEGRNATVETVGDALALAALEEQIFVARIVHEGNLRKHRRHVGVGQDDEGCLLHAPVRFARAHELETLRERVLDIDGKLSRLPNHLVACDFFNQFRKIVEGRLRERVFARR